ncbi:MAG: hypothetical protein Ct9H300mP29_4280 [Candidatus Neomarinimicrobiota bacterium]|nr:MAG: hypothetical protein Ct9H300mP29_4280 [Candidatus Neomarinimicrobiota bacterium]
MISFSPYGNFQKKKPFLVPVQVNMMAKSVPDSRVEPLGIIDIEIDRNAMVDKSIHLRISFP